MAANTINGAIRPTWQEKLQNFCKLSNLPAPVFNLVSDRRGGRTAWSSNVSIQGITYSGRYFYDGSYTENAKEDAAEVAFTVLSSHVRPTSTTTLQGRVYA